MIIAGLQKTTLIDYPGKVACTVFLAGCNFKCPWCYSAELVLPEKISKQPKISQEDLFSFLKERKGLLEGVVLCGGEPTVQKGLPRFVEEIKKMGFLVKLDTNGSNPEVSKKLLDEKLIDYVAQDIKLPKDKYGEILGVKAENIQKSIDVLKQGRVDFEFRTTVVPTVHTKEDILKIADWIKGPKVKYYLQNFRPEKTIDPEFEEIKPYSDDFLLDIKETVSPFFGTCEIR